MAKEWWDIAGRMNGPSEIAAMSTAILQRVPID